MRSFIAALLCLPLLANAAFTAKAYVVMDMAGQVIKAENPDEIRSIASITKLITVTRSSQLSADELIKLEPADFKLGHMRSTPLKVGEQYTRAQLTELALISSDNVAATALGRSAVPAELPPSTTIVDASGLNPENKSTARSIANLARSLYNTQTAATSVEPRTELGDRRSTNPLLSKPGWTFYLSKTGFINESGGCLVVITQVGQRLLTIAILGSKDTHQRWRDLAELRHELGDTGFYDPPTARTKHRRRHR